MSKSKNKNFVKYNNFENFIKQTNENTLFQNRVIEKTVLNLMMTDSEKQQLATQYLTDEHFFYQGHKDLFRYIKDKRELIGFGSSVDFFEIRNMIEDEESKIKYPLVTTNLINEISSMFVNEENFLNNVENLIELNKMRNLEVFYNLSLDAMSHNKKITWDGSVQDFETFLEENNLSSLQNSSFISFASATKEMEELIGLALENKLPEGLLTGFDKLDQIIKGFKPGQLIVLAARPGVGKTALALNIVKNISSVTEISEDGITTIKPNHCAFISLEMPYTELTYRLFSSITNIHLAKLQKPSLLQSNELEILANSFKENINNENLFLDDNTSSRITDLIWKIKHLHKIVPGGLKLVVIDYLQLISGNNLSGNRQNEVAQISRSLKVLALDLKIPIIALSQLSRSVEQRTEKRPQLSDLRESGAIEQDADIVIFLSRNILDPKKDDDASKFDEYSLTQVTVAKNRNGQPGYTEMLYKGNIVTFFDEKS